MACKNNKKNRRKAVFYRISKFDYKAKKRLAERQPSPKETPIEEKVVENNLGNA